MSRATLKKRIAAIKEGVPSVEASCCIINVAGIRHCYRWHDEHMNDPEPRPLPPCRRTGGKVCQNAHDYMKVFITPPDYGTPDFTEDEL